VRAAQVMHPPVFDAARLPSALDQGAVITQHSVKGHGTSQEPPALALVPLHIRNPLAGAVAFCFSNGR
jgi:hypothetical protein